jgi:hypothetical protein
VETRRFIGRIEKLVMRFCIDCKKFKKVTYVKKRGKEKTSYRCRECNTKICKKYRDAGGMKPIRERIEKYEKANPEKRRAWNLAKEIPLMPCETCGTTKKIHRHHDDYTKPMQVRFLCPAHHKQAHMKEK